MTIKQQRRLAGQAENNATASLALPKHLPRVDLVIEPETHHALLRWPVASHCEDVARRSIEFPPCCGVAHDPPEICLPRLRGTICRQKAGAFD